MASPPIDPRPIETVPSSELLDIVAIAKGDIFRPVWKSLDLAPGGKSCTRASVKSHVEIAFDFLPLGRINVVFPPGSISSSFPPGSINILSPLGRFLVER